MNIPLSDITVNARKRPLNPAKVQQLLESIREIGLLHPITLTPDYTLICGLHRLEAYRLLGERVIPAEIKRYDEVRLKLAELQENSARNELTALEQAEAQAESKQFYEALHPEATAGALRAAGMNRAQGHNVGAESAPTSFVKATAAAANVSTRSIHQNVQIAANLTPAVKEAIRDTPLADQKTELLKLASMTPERQEAVVDRYVKGEGTLAHVAHATGDPDWYTPADIIAAVHEVLGEIDLDPASCDDANKVVQAAQIFTVEEDGLAHDWHGRIFLNPPFSASLVKAFTEKLVAEQMAGRVTEAILLVNNCTETEWWQNAARHADLIAFPKGRVKFWSPIPKGSTPLQGQAVLYYGQRGGYFRVAFMKLGLVYGNL